MALDTPEHTNQVEIAPTLFKAYDIRGKADVVLTESAVEAIGLAFAERLKTAGESRLVIGRDGRLSSERLQQAFMRGVASQNIAIINLGEVTSPMVYFAAETLDNVNACAVITGSHNPPEDNGIKLVLQGNALYGEQIQALRERIVSSAFDACLQQAKNLPGWGYAPSEMLDIFPAYCQRVTADIVLERPFKVVVDAGNGVAGRFAPDMLRAVGCEVIELFCDVDGRFPNHHPDPAKPENLADLRAAVLAHRADVGLAFDGDGDRCGVVDNHGRILVPDRQLILFAREILKRHQGAIILYDVKCSSLVAKEVSSAGGQAVMWKTGHSLMKAKMKATEAILGGEMSGHLFFGNRWYGFDDAIYTAVRLMELISKQSNSTSALFDTIPEWINTPEIQVDLPEGGAPILVNQFLVGLKEQPDDAVKNLIELDGVRAEYQDGWGLVRASNTTSSLTIRFEARSQAALHQIQIGFKKRLRAIKPDLKFPF